MTIVVHVGQEEWWPGGRLGPPMSKSRHEHHYAFDPDVNLADSYAEYRRELRRGIPRSERLSPALFLPIGVQKASQAYRHLAGRVDVVHMHNVFSDPETANHRQVLAAIKGLLKPGGKLYIGHLISPHVFPKERLASMAKRFNLEIKILVENSSGRRRPWSNEERRILQKIMGRSGLARGFLSSGAYLAVLAKKGART